MLVIFFHQEILLGRVFSPADQLFKERPWATVAPPGFLRPTNPLRGDETFVFEPHRVDIVRDIARNGVVLWQGHTIAGSAETFALHFLGTLVYPPMLAFLVFPAGTATTILHLSIPLLAALSMYLLLGLLVRRPVARLLGACAFALNGYMIAWLSAFFLPLTMAVLPLAMYLAFRFLEERRPRFGVLYALVLGFTFFLGYPPGNIVFVTVLAIAFTTWWLASPRRRLGALATLAGFSLLGVGIGMIAILPTLADLTNFESKAYRPPLGPAPPRFLGLWLFPNLAGNPVQYDWGTVGNYCEYVAYEGGLVLLLAAAGVVMGARRRLRPPALAVAAGLVTIAGLALTYFPPLVHLVVSHPPFKDLNPARWQVATDLGLALLAAYGFDRLLDAGGRWRRRVALAAAAAVVVTAGVVAQARAGQGPLDGFITDDLRWRLALFGVGLLMIALLGVPRLRTVAAGAVVGVLFLDMFTFGAGFNPTVQPRDFYPRTPALDYLAAHSPGYKVLPVGGEYSGDVFNVYGIDVITGYDHLRDDAYISYLGANVSPGERLFWQQSGFLLLGQAVQLDDHVFDTLAVKYAYYTSSSQARSVRSAHWQEVYRGADGTIFENLDVLPAQFLVPDGGAPVPINHVPARPDGDRLQVRGGGTLVWAKPLDRQWRITVNGRVVRAHAYGAFLMSVALGTGDNDVVITYEPPAYLEGAVVSALSALVLLVIVGLGSRGGRWRRLRRRVADQPEVAAGTLPG